jgi:hypothetical protein
MHHFNDTMKTALYNTWYASWFSFFKFIFLCTCILIYCSFWQQCPSEDFHCNEMILIVSVLVSYLFSLTNLQPTNLVKPLLDPAQLVFSRHSAIVHVHTAREAILLYTPTQVQHFLYVALRVRRICHKYLNVSKCWNTQRKILVTFNQSMWLYHIPVYKGRGVYEKSLGVQQFLMVRYVSRYRPYDTIHITIFEKPSRRSKRTIPPISKPFNNYFAALKACFPSKYLKQKIRYMNLSFFIAAQNTKLFILEICRSLESAAQSTLCFTLPDAILL